LFHLSCLCLKCYSTLLVNKLGLAFFIYFEDCGVRAFISPGYFHQLINLRLQHHSMDTVLIKTMAAEDLVGVFHRVWSCIRCLLLAVNQFALASRHAECFPVLVEARVKLYDSKVPPIGIADKVLLAGAVVDHAEVFGTNGGYAGCLVPGVILFF
jgi:hypothetical protein